MPRGRPQRRGTSQRYQLTDRRPREAATRASGDVDSGTDSTEPHSDLPHPLQATGEDSRWDGENPGNWSAVTLRQKIEARGLKLPSSMKKAQLLSLFLDNFDKGPSVPATTTTGGVDRPEPPLSSEPLLPPEPRVAPLSSPQPTSSRWSVASNLNIIATRARQIHQRAGSLPGNVRFDETINRSRRVHQPRASERATAEPEASEVDSSHPSDDLGSRRAEPLADVVFALQQSVSAMADQMREFRDSTLTAPTTSRSPANVQVPTPMATMRTTLDTTGTTFTLTTAMEDIERSTGTSLRATSAFIDTTRWQPRSTAGFASESLPEVETVSPALRSAILDGKDVNLACLLIPHFDLGDYSRYAGVDGCQQLLRPLSSDPRLNRNLTMSEFVTSFNKYRNIMCEVWERRKELDAYEAIVVGIASRIDGTAYYEYHKSFSARASALIQQQNVKVDWGVRDNGLFCSLFVGHVSNSKNT